MKSTRRKKRFYITLIICVAFLSVFSIFFVNKLMATNILPVDSVAMSLVNDGTYHGNSNNGLIEVEVEVTVSNHEITKIDIIKHNNGLGSKAEKITQNIISEQSLEVDTIASATYSSNTILKAVENALLKGK